MGWSERESRKGGARVEREREKEREREMERGREGGSRREEDVHLTVR